MVYVLPLVRNELWWAPSQLLLPQWMFQVSLLYLNLYHKGLIGHNGSVPHINRPFPSISKRREGHFHSRNSCPAGGSNFCQTGPKRQCDIRKAYLVVCVICLYFSQQCFEGSGVVLDNKVWAGTLLLMDKT